MSNTFVTVQLVQPHSSPAFRSQCLPFLPCHPFYAIPKSVFKLTQGISTHPQSFCALTSPRSTIFLRLGIPSTHPKPNSQPPDRTLASYKPLSALPPASPSSIATYKSFLETHNPIAAAETAFLDHPTDLVSISCPCGGHAGSRAHAEIGESIPAGERSVLRTVGAVLVFVAVWKMVPSFLGRLVLGAVVLGGCVWGGLLPRAGTDGEGGAEGRGWSGVG